MNSTVSEVLAQNLPLGLLLSVVLPLLGRTPELLALIGSRRKLNQILEDMISAQDAAEKFETSQHDAAYVSTNIYLRSVLQPQFNKRLADKANARISRRAPKFYRISPHGLTVLCITGGYIVGASLAYAASPFIVATTGMRLQYIVPLTLMGGLAGLFFIGNFCEKKLIPKYYAPKYFIYRVRALGSFNNDYGIDYPLIVRNGPRFDVYAKQEDGSYKPADSQI